jgi:hypothetical protein
MDSQLQQVNQFEVERADLQNTFAKEYFIPAIMNTSTISINTLHYLGES